MFNIRDLVTNNIECHNALMQFVESGNCGKLHIFQRSISDLGHSLTKKTIFS